MAQLTGVVKQKQKLKDFKHLFAIHLLSLLFVLELFVFFRA